VGFGSILFQSSWPWYSRFVAAPTLSITEKGTTEIYTGQGVIEFMDFHLNA
jgi:hypothetical protein